MKTKFVFKIEYYYEDTNQIDVRVGRSTSKSINDCRKVTVDLEKLDLLTWVNQEVVLFYKEHLQLKLVQELDKVFQLML